MKFLLIAVTILLLVVAYFLKKKYTTDTKKHMLNIANILLVVLLLELTIFNVNSYRLDFKDYQKKEYNIDATYDTEDMKADNEDEKRPKKYTLKREIKGINDEIATIKLNIETNKPVKYTVYYTDETSEGYRRIPSKVLIGGLENSKSIPCFLSGKTDKIKVELELSEGTVIELNSIQINEPIQFQFNSARFIVLSCIIIFIYALLKVEELNDPYDEKNKSHKAILIIVTVAFIGLLYWCMVPALDDERSYGRVYTELFIDSIKEGQVSLLMPASDELKQMENPYDRTAREENEVLALWDAAYYDGEYYMYFGIFPVLTLLMPYHMITGEYMTAHVATFIYIVLATLFMVEIILSAYKRWFSKVPLKMLIVAIITMLMGNLMLWLCSRASMYELVIAAGYYLVMQGISCIFKAIENEKVNYKYLLIACASLALAVSARPTLLLVSIVIIPVLIKILIENIKKRKNILKLILTVGIPYAIVGISLMVYNYIRFDSVFDFGANYQLTVNDMGNLSYRILTIPLGLINYFLTLPNTSGYFPFVETTLDTMTFYGYYSDSPMAAGLIILNPILLALIFIPKIKKHISKDMFKWIVSMVSVAFVIAIIEIVVGGSYERYAVDYAWMLLLTAILIIFTIYGIIKNRKIREYIFKLLLVIAVYSSIMNFLLCGIQGETDACRDVCTDKYYSTRYSISFWE